VYPNLQGHLQGRTTALPGLQPGLQAAHRRQQRKSGVNGPGHHRFHISTGAENRQHGVVLEGCDLAGEARDDVAE